MTKDVRDIEKITAGIIAYLKSKGKLYLLPEVSKKLENEYTIETDFVSITTGFKVDLKMKKKLKILVDKLIGKTPLKTNYFVDAAIVDGVIVRYKDRVWDLSLKGEMQRLVETITN